MVKGEGLLIKYEKGEIFEDYREGVGVNFD